MFTMLPLRPSATTRRQYTCEHNHSPRRFTSTSRVHCSSVRSRNGTIVSIPALFTSTSRGPSSFHTLSIMASTSARRDTSPFADRATPFFANPLRDSLGLFWFLDIIHRHVRAFFREHFHNPASNPTVCASNQRNFSFKLHGHLHPSSFFLLVLRVSCSKTPADKLSAHPLRRSSIHPSSREIRSWS